MFLQQLIKSKDRVRDHGEVFTPDFVVSSMLDLLKHETERLDSRFLEPACGDGNFLVQVLTRKLDIVNKKYNKNQFDFEKYAFTAVASVYGIDLLQDNISSAQHRLYHLVEKSYLSARKKQSRIKFLEVISFVLSKNIVQGDVLSLKDQDNQPIVFTEWSFLGYKVKRREFVFEELISKELQSHGGFFADHIKSDHGQSVFISKPRTEYTNIHFLDLLS